MGLGGAPRFRPRKPSWGEQASQESLPAGQVDGGPAARQEGVEEGLGTVVGGSIEGCLLPFPLAPQQGLWRVQGLPWKLLWGLQPGWARGAFQPCFQNGPSWAAQPCSPWMPPHAPQTPGCCQLGECRRGAQGPPHPPQAHSPWGLTHQGGAKGPFLRTFTAPATQPSPAQTAPPHIRCSCPLRGLGACGGPREVPSAPGLPPRGSPKECQGAPP